MRVNPVIVTSINLGYVPLLQNLRFSLSQAGILENLKIFSYGESCHEDLARRGLQSILIKPDKQIDRAVNFRKHDWKYITYQKIRSIHLALEMFDGFLYTDPDVVFNRDVFPYLETLPDAFDIYGQRDLVPDHAICSGFMYIQRNSKTRDIFSISWEDYQKETGIGDQRYINKNRDKLKLYGLPAELFLGGVWFCPGPRFKISSEILRNAYIAHYNFTSCMLEKYIRMKKNQHIFVLPTFLERVSIITNGLFILAERFIKNSIQKIRRRISKL